MRINIRDFCNVIPKRTFVFKFQVCQFPPPSIVVFAYQDCIETKQCTLQRTKCILSVYVVNIIDFQTSQRLVLYHDIALTVVASNWVKLLLILYGKLCRALSHHKICNILYNKYFTWSLATTVSVHSWYRYSLNWICVHVRPWPRRSVFSIQSGWRLVRLVFGYLTSL